MRILWYIVTFAVLVQSSCACTDSTKKDTTTIVPQEIKIIDEEIVTDHFDLDMVLAEWRKDSITCLGLRDPFKADFLIEKLHLKQSTKDEIVKLLGPPNTIIPYRESDFSNLSSNRDDFIVLRYYYSSACYKGKLYTKGACWVEIVLYKDSGKVADIYMPCE